MKRPQWLGATALVLVAVPWIACGGRGGGACAGSNSTCVALMDTWRSVTATSVSVASRPRYSLGGTLGGMTDLDQALELGTRAVQPAGLLIAMSVCITEVNPLTLDLALPVMRAVGKAAPVLCFDADVLQSAVARQGMDMVSVEREGTRGKDIRVFIVARNLA